MNKKGENGSGLIWIIILIAVAFFLFKGQLFSIYDIGTNEASAGIGNEGYFMDTREIIPQTEIDGANISISYEFNGIWSKEQYAKVDIYNYKKNAWENLINEQSSGKDSKGTKSIIATLDYIKDNSLFIQIELFTLTMTEEEQIEKERSIWSSACAKEEQDWLNQPHRSGNFIPSNDCLEEPEFSAYHGSSIKINSVDAEFYERGKYTFNTPIIICENLRAEDNQKICTSNLKEYENKCIAVVAGVYGDKACYGECPCPIIKYINSIPQYQTDTVIIPSSENKFQWWLIFVIIGGAILIYFTIKNK